MADSAADWTHADGSLGSVSVDSIYVPQFRKFERPWAMAEGFIDFHEQALELLGVVIGTVNGHLDLPLLELFLIENGDGSVDTDRFIEAGYQEEESDVRVLIQVVIGLEQSVAGDVGNDEVTVVDDPDEAGFPTLRVRE